MRPPLVPHGRELSARELVAQWCPPVQAALCHRCVQCAGGSADPVRRHGSGTAHTCQRSRGADETVRLFELPVGASGQREHKRLAAAHVRVRRVHRELGRGGRCRRAQQRQHGP